MAEDTTRGLLARTANREAMRVGIVAQLDNPRASALAADIARHLDGIDVVVDPETGDSIAEDTDLDVETVPVAELASCQLAVSIGGDGTFLHAARGAGTTPIMGVNLGEVGFLNAVPPEDAVETVASEAERYRETGSVRTRTLHRLQASGEDWTLPPAINEVAILGEQRGHGRGIDLEVRVDGSLFTSGRADGLLVATPTGSTAYNLSEGGPLVHPDVGGLILTTMAGREGTPPLVVDRKSVVDVRVENAESAVAVTDGRARQELSLPATVQLARAEEPLHVVGPPLAFFAGLGKLD